MAERIAIVGGRPQLVRAAAAFGLRPVLVHARNAVTPDVAGLCERVVETDLLDEQAVTDILEALHGERPFVRVVSLSEDGSVPSARVNERHGLGGCGLAAARLLKDKAAMRRRLDEVGLGAVRWRIVDSAVALADFVSELGGPAVVKPLDAGGSQLVSRIDRAGDAPVVWARGARAGRDRMLAEEYLTGQEISVEAFSVDGRHTVVAMTDKVVGPNFVEIGHAIPAAVAPQQYQAAAELTVALLDAVGLADGASHTELKLTPDGPRVVESHNRAGGDNLADLIDDVYGVDLERFTIGVAIGAARWRSPVLPECGGSAIRYLVASPGVVASVKAPGAEELPPGVTLHIGVVPGALVPPVEWSMDRVCGYVRATGRSAAMAMARCEEVADLVHVEVVPSRGGPDG